MNDTGCDSRYSNEKKESIAARYIGQQMTVTGTVEHIDNGTVGIRVSPTTLTYDVLVDLANPKATYNLEKGQATKGSPTSRPSQSSTL